MRSTSTRPYLSARGLARVGDGLSSRDVAIVRQVAELRLMSARQIGAVHFPCGEHASEAAAIRARQRVLARLVRERLLRALVRRIGGIRAGSAGLVFTLGPVGQRALALDGARRRAYEPGQRFFDHSLAVSQLVVDLTLAARAGDCELLDVEPEPRCWRDFTRAGARQVLRPDLFVSLGVGDYELRWFCEVDRATESLPTIQKKCRLYADYYQSGAEQAEHGVYPRVCWVVPDEARAERVRGAIGRDRRLPEGLFRVTASDEAVDILTGLGLDK